MTDYTELGRAERSPTEETVERIKALLEYVHWETFIDGVEKDPDSNDIEDIYPLPSSSEGSNLVGTTDDLAIVKYKGIEEPHKHINGETEAHVVAEGAALYVIGGIPVPLEQGGSIVIAPELPHFAEPLSKDPFVKEPFVAVVASSPTFNPENQVPVEPDDPLGRATLQMHELAVRAN